MYLGADIKREILLFAFIFLVLGPVPIMSIHRHQENKTTSAAAAFALLLPEEISGWKESRPDEVYGRENIFDYMDGAGEIYLAYDFQFVFVREYVRANSPSLMVEIYQMSSSEDAFGVFTQDLDGNEVNLGQDALYAAGLLRFWKDKIFVRIMADKETAEIKPVIMKLGEIIVAASPQEGIRPSLISAVPSAGLRPKTLRYFHTLISLNSHYFLAGENVLNLSSDTQVVLTQYEKEKSRARLLLVAYRSPNQAEAANKQFVKIYLKDKALPEGKVQSNKLEDGQFAGILRRNRFLIIVLDAEALPLAEWLFEETSQKLEEEN